MRYNERYKTMLFNDRLIHMTIRNQIEERQMDREQLQIASRVDADSTASKTQQGLTFWETRKINEQNLNEMKARMQEHIRKKTQEFRALKTEVKQEIEKEVELNHEEKRLEVTKQREIKKIIKNEQKQELDRNIQVFQHLNKEEKGLRRELCDKQIELEFKEKYLKRVNVRHQLKQQNMKKEEREKFIGSFAQAKNLIEKQMKLGNMIRDRKQALHDNKKKVASRKMEIGKDDHNIEIKCRLYHNSALEESTQRSSIQGGGQYNFASNSMYQQSPMGMSQTQDQSQLVGKYRTESAAKPFGIKRPPMPGRVASGEQYQRVKGSMFQG